ncbi:Outer-membrane lipoprotein carrier protein [Dyadobacter sp. CECT 9275]|uniref:Outer-membrane lipoprotein carrier protein n=1 Tax=Dyadobacter helix TaxID=2822344 RepID=A0A916J945_9BACT|nr:outer membrane lipoprotein carrier protein LolA [Dyadobacter sp. CECT 9275]CAG4995054.1 Outer-membrane lipoprotein carrier protein [Dyadobacter sp. CECT 9275]
MLKYPIFLFLFFVQIHSVSAQDFKPVQDPAQVVAELKKSAQNTGSIQANFKEEKYLAVLKEPQKTAGIFYYQKENKMRWEQESPSRYIILINGDQMRVSDNGKEKNVAAGRMAGQIKDLMIGLVNGDFQDNKGFSKAYFEKADQYLIVLTPVNKRLKNVYSKISLVFTKSSFRLRELTFFEKSGDKSIMKFSNEKINQPITAGIFDKL